ncbi:serine/threonine-protein kinase [Streptomyces sp. NPDC002055]|uniref:serine/threonine-protein kinase n=1 Tax=Streptomyces sp. NPDC002055 TaxID=3154534 RepID=UPI003320D784
MYGAESDEGRLVAARYRLLERIGRGGMGTVWRAEDEMLGRHVALKKLHVAPHQTDEERATLYERTRREARSAARITHPNVVVVHDVVDDGGLPCIVMEYVPSRTLSEVLKEDGPQAPDEVARIGRGMIAALRAAHDAGVLHRDVKPGNVLLSRGGRVVLTDFGIAMASGTSTLTKTGELVGSVDYVAPERVRGGSPGPASDLWALGATLYQALEGQPPFRKATAIETAYSIAVDPLEPPRSAGALGPLIEELLAKTPEGRPDAGAVERRLREPAAEAETATVDRTRVLDTDAVPETASGHGAEPGTGTGTATDTAPGSARPAGSFGPVIPGPRQETPAPAAAMPASTAQTPTGTTPTGTAPPGTTHSGITPPGTGPSGTIPSGAAATATTATTAPSGRRRTWLWAVAVVVAAAAAVGGTLMAMNDANSGVEVSPGNSRPAGSGASKGTEPTAEPSPVPPGYHLVTEKKIGVSFPVPDGWKRDRKSTPEQLIYVDPTGLVGVRINVIDFASTDPLAHFRNVESNLKADTPSYRQLRMDRTKFRDAPAAVWEFTLQGTERKFRAIDLGFGRVGGKEYAVYLSAPDLEWAKHRPIFDHVRNGLRLPKDAL